MIEQNVQIVRCEHNTVWVRIGSRTGCATCDNGQGCGAGVFARLLERKPVVLELPVTNDDLRVGQMATLEFPEQLYLKLVMANYGWPLLVALLSAWGAFSLMSHFGSNGIFLDLVTLAGGVLGGALMWHLARRRGATQQILNELKMAVCKPSAAPGLCEKQIK